MSDCMVENVETLGLINSGAGGKFIDQNFTKESGFKTLKLEEPLRVLNVDGTENKRGTIKDYVELNLEINGRKSLEQLMVTGLGKEQIILGFPWLTDHNPDINWKTGQFSRREPAKRRFFNLPIRKENKTSPRRFFKLPPWKQDKVFPKPSVEEIPDEEENKNRTQNPALDDDLELGSTYLDKEEFDIWLNAKTTTSSLLRNKSNWTNS